MLKKLLTIVILCCFSILSNAQIEERGTPKSLLSASMLSIEVPEITMPVEEIDMPKLLAEDDLDVANNLPLRFAHRFYQNHNLQNSGQWETLANGDRVWRLTISSPGAMGITLGYSDFYMPKGAKFYVYNTYDVSDRIGAFTTRNNKSHRQFTTRPVFSDKITLEYYEPQSVQGQGAIEVAVIGHAYRDLDGRTMSEKSGACQVSINCPEGANWQDEKKGVARILIDMAFLCSGTLITNTAQDGTPYFSTANHCIAATGHDALGNSLVPLWVFYWNYECLVGSCDNEEPGDDCTQGPEQTTTGGNIVASSGGPGQGVNLALEFADFALILLDENPVEAGYDVFFNGWDRRGPETLPLPYAPTQCIGIHHPAGDVKKIATDNTGAIVESTGHYWELFWEATPNGHSVTEGGSSGSPLFDKNTGLVIGQLFGGSSVNCTNPAEDRAIYGGFFYSFTNPDNPSAIAADARKLEPWLDPMGTGDQSVAGHYPDGTIPPPPVPQLIFKQPTSNAVETPETADLVGCSPYKDYIVNILLTRLPNTPVTLTVSADAGTSSADEMIDFEVMNNVVTLGQDATNLIADITVRVYDDGSVENSENINLIYQIDENYMGDAIAGTGNQQHNLLLADNDFTPEVAASQLVTIFEDNFDNVTTTWTPTNGLAHSWVIGGTNAATTAAGMTANCAYVRRIGVAGYAYNENGTADDLSIRSRAIDATGITNLSVSFDWAVGGEVNFDFGTFVYSTDGTTLLPLPTPVTLVDKSDGTTFSIALPAALENSTFFIGFTWEHDETFGTPQPLAFDNVVVTGISGGAADVAVNMATSPAAQLSPMTTLYFYDDAGNIMLSLKNLDDTHNFGCATVSIDRAGTSHTPSWETGKDILNKTFNVNVENNATGIPYEVTLYYTNAEIQGWAGNQAGDAISALKMVKTNGAIANGTPTNYATSPATAATYGSDYTYTATFSNGFSGFGLGNVSDATALAVELLDFSAQPLQKSILLQWSTQSEIDHQGFEIQKSTRPQHGFESIGWSASKGKGAEYLFEDAKVEAGQLYYYRLKQVDVNGKVTYSAIITAEIASLVTTQVMPNPVHDQLSINVATKSALAGQLQLIDILGREIWSQSFATEHTLALTIPMASLSNGIYFLQVIAQGEVLSNEKIVKK